MGKLKKGRKNQKARNNPLAGKKGHATKQEVKDESTRQSKILPLINKLTSTVPNERAMAVGAITVLAEDARMRRMLLKERLLAILMENCLNDLNDEIVVESFGLLRNIAIEEGYEVAKFCWRQNIWAAIEAALAKIEKSFKFLSEDDEKKKSEKAKTQLLYDFTENVLLLVVALASGSGDLYDGVFAKIDPILVLVVDLINWNVPTMRTSFKLLNALLDFVYEFSSESLEFIQKLKIIGAFDIEKLAEAVSASSHDNNRLGRVYVEGIRYQMYEAAGADKNATANAVLGRLFEITTRVDLNTVASQLAPVDNANEPIKPPTDGPTEDIDQQISGDTPEKAQARSDVQALEVALDISTSVVEYVAVGEPGEPVEISPELTETVMSRAFPSFRELLVHDERLGGVLQLSSKALAALNNVVWLFLAADNVPNDWDEQVETLWEVAVRLLARDNLSLQKECLSVLWAVAKTVPEMLSRVDNTIVESLMARCQRLAEELPDATDATELVEFVLATVGFLGAVAPGTEVLVVGQIGEFLLLSATFFAQEGRHADTAAVEVVVETLNAVYDVFGDGSYAYDQPVFVQGGFLERLRSLQGPVREVYKSIDKNRHAELRMRAEEAWTNLGRFVQYKEEERN